MDDVSSQADFDGNLWPVKSTYPQQPEEHFALAVTVSKSSFVGIPLVHHDGPGDSSYSYWLPDSGTTTHMTPLLSDLLPEKVSKNTRAT